MNNSKFYWTKLYSHSFCYNYFSCDSFLHLIFFISCTIYYNIFHKLYILHIYAFTHFIKLFFKLVSYIQKMGDFKGKNKSNLFVWFFIFEKIDFECFSSKLEFDQFQIGHEWIVQYKLIIMHITINKKYRV